LEVTGTAGTTTWASDHAGSFVAALEPTTTDGDAVATLEDGARARVARICR